MTQPNPSPNSFMQQYERKSLCVCGCVVFVCGRVWACVCGWRGGEEYAVLLLGQFKSKKILLNVLYCFQCFVILTKFLVCGFGF